MHSVWLQWSAKHLAVAYKKHRNILRRLRDVYLWHIYLYNQLGVCVLSNIVNIQLDWHPTFYLCSLYHAACSVGFSPVCTVHILSCIALFSCVLLFVTFSFDNSMISEHGNEPKKSYEVKVFPGKIRILIVSALNSQHLHCIWWNLIPHLVLIFCFLG
jgi:hypothetical protein